MKLGLVSDIHGNRHALEAVVADAATQGVDRWWVLGDLVAIGPEPVQTLELVANLPAVQVTSGNTERYVLTDDRPSPHPDDVIARPELLDLYAVIQPGGASNPITDDLRASYVHADRHGHRIEHRRVGYDRDAFLGSVDRSGHECEDGVVQQGSISYARIADRYEHVRGGAERAAQLADALAPWLPDGRIADVAAGTGIVTGRLARPGVELVACDLSVEMLVQAVERLPGRIHVADAGALAFRDAAMDALTYVWVLHSVADLRVCLDEAWRVLRPGGRVLSMSGLSLPVGDDMAPIFDALSDTLRPGRREQAMAVSSVGGDVGFELLHEGFANTGDVSPNALADGMEERLFAHLWDLSDEAWGTHVEPALAELRALPYPDRTRRRVFHHPLVVLEKR